ncbi:AAA family ATPase [Streptomyces sp. NPDC048211]|uniref:AAA family ATPase n=1 Tax=Streptomyces sp. NPDC048211 TaxID=3365516 RepID=UPI003719EEA5
MPSPSPEPSPTPDEIVQQIIAKDLRDRNIRDLAEHELLKRDARRYADALERKDDRKPVWRSLSEQLERPLNPQLYSIDRLLPLSGNGLFAGRYKAGKTTFNGQLLKAWADADEGAKFLGEFPCYPDPDRPNVTFFNYEMSEDQLQRWLARVGIINTHRVNLVHLRGLSMPFGIEAVRKELAQQLADAGTGLWVVDPASRAFAGAGDVNDNSAVATWLGQLDEIKAEAGVRDLVLNIHMSHGAAKNTEDERAIGAQAWSAWADALWFLNKKEEKGITSRWFSADGRDVHLDKLLVSYQAEDMSVALVEADPDKHAEHELRNTVIRVIREDPGITATQIRSNAGAFIKARVTEFDQTVADLISEQLVRVIQKGKAKRHYWYDQMPQPVDDDHDGDDPDSDNP